VRHPVTAPEALNRAADYIKRALASYGCEVSEHHFSEDDRDHRNILGLRRGIRYSNRYLLVLAHFDTEQDTPGANDNASGVAAMLELARVTQTLIFEGNILFIGANLEELKCGVNPEEVDLNAVDLPIARGSQKLVEFVKNNAWDIQGVINFEEIAYAGDSVAQITPKGAPFTLPPVGNFIAVIGNTASTELLKGFISSIERNQILLPYVPLIVPENGQAFPDTRRSDHAPFWDAGYRAIMLTDTANFRTPHYHRPSDTLETLNLQFAAEVCRAAAGLVLDLAGLVDQQISE
jgi:Zn-dependent M28 family amino/carboxypeptidase